jgi:hypothetical protein
MSVLSEQWTLPPGRGGNRVVVVALINQHGYHLARLRGLFGNADLFGVGMRGRGRHGVVGTNQADRFTEDDWLNGSARHEATPAGHSAGCLHVTPPLSPDYRITDTRVDSAQLHPRQPALSTAGNWL